MLSTLPLTSFRSTRSESRMSKPPLLLPNLGALVYCQSQDITSYPYLTLPQVIAYPLQGVLCSTPRHQHPPLPHKKCGITSPLNPFHSEGQPLTKSSTTPPCWQNLPSMTLPGSATSWLDEWSHQHRGGLLLQAAEPWPDEEYTHACINADTQCLHLLSLLFNLEITIYKAIQRWRHCVACCKYRLAPEFVMLD